MIIREDLELDMPGMLHKMFDVHRIIPECHLRFLLSRIIRFFLGYSGWECEQLIQEIKENTWIISKEENTYLMNEDIKGMWKEALGKLGSKYETWSRFPQVPSLN